MKVIPSTNVISSGMRPIPLATWMYIVMMGAAMAFGDGIEADVVLRGGMIVDGTGSAPFRADLALRDGRIAAIGNLETSSARRWIDCSGLVVAPGFIDLHNHSDESILDPATRSAACYLMQGCTLLVTGNCGSGHLEVGQYYDKLDQYGTGVNIAHLIPHGTLRDRVMGKGRQPADEDEVRRMRALAAMGMRQGAWGISTGLQYVPGCYAGTDELVAIAAVVGNHGGLYASHIRDEGDRLVESIQEALDIGRRGRVRVHISHFKASKRRNWGKVRAAARMIEQARTDGLMVTADQYPYNASSTSIRAMLLPDEEREGGERALIERLDNRQHVARLRPIISDALEARERLLIAGFEARGDWVGKTIREVALEQRRSPVDVAVDLLRGGGAQGINFSMDENDVRFVMTLPWVATASDGSSKIDDGTLPHPRSYGTFPRKIGYYAVRQKVLSLAAAIRSATGLPADILGLVDRGYLRKDYAADIVVFDPKEYCDRATFQQPYRMPVGVRWVFVNGTVSVADGELRPVRAGRALRRPRASRQRD